MAKQIPLQNGMFAIVDDEDYEMLIGVNWGCYHSASKTSVNVYNSNKGMLSRYILGVSNDKLVVIHINGNYLDFQKENLITVERNKLTLIKRGNQGSSSSYKGVSWSKERNKWVASIKFDGKNRNLGRFHSEIEAAKAYNKAALKHHGNLAYLNVIDECNNARCFENQ